RSNQVRRRCADRESLSGTRHELRDWSLPVRKAALADAATCGVLEGESHKLLVEERFGYAYRLQKKERSKRLVIDPFANHYCRRRSWPESMLRPGGARIRHQYQGWPQATAQRRAASLTATSTAPGSNRDG